MSSPRSHFGVEVLELARYENASGDQIYRFDPFLADLDADTAPATVPTRGVTPAPTPTEVDTVVVPAREEEFQEPSWGKTGGTRCACTARCARKFATWPRTASHPFRDHARCASQEHRALEGHRQLRSQLRRTRRRTLFPPTPAAPAHCTDAPSSLRANAARRKSSGRTSFNAKRSQAPQTTTGVPPDLVLRIHADRTADRPARCRFARQPHERARSARLHRRCRRRARRSRRPRREVK